MRSRTVSRPWSRCRLTLSTPPISRANASRRARSSSSGFQFILFLRDNFFGDFIVMCWGRQRLVLGAIAEGITFVIPQHAGNGGAQFEEPRRDLPVQSFLVEHRGQQADGDDHEGL